MMVYALWDVVSGNVVDTFTSEAAALREVRDAVELGAAEVLGWALQRKDDAGHREGIAEGQALIDRAPAATSAA